MNGIKADAEGQEDSDAQKRLLAAAKVLADATAKLVEAAKVRLRYCYPVEREKSGIVQGKFLRPRPIWIVYQIFIQYFSQGAYLKVRPTPINSCGPVKVGGRGNYPLYSSIRS